jgi:hypothetical protein
VKGAEVPDQDSETIPASRLATMAHEMGGVEVLTLLREVLDSLGTQPIQLTPPTPALASVDTWEFRLVRKRSGRERLEVVGGEHFVETLSQIDGNVRHFFFDSNGYSFHGLLNEDSTKMLDAFAVRPSQDNYARG